MSSDIGGNKECPVLHSEFSCLWEQPPEKNTSNYLLRKCEEHVKNGREVCVRNAATGETLTYDEVEKISRKISSKFWKLGLKAGDTVITSTHDPTKAHVFMLGIWRANGVVRSSYPEDTGEVLVKRIKECKARFIACDSHAVAEYISAANSVTEWTVTVISIGDDHEGCVSFHEFLEDDGSCVPETTSELDDVALILPTSGTTGDSKGAIYTHRILMENILAHENMPYTDMNMEATIITSRQTHYVGSVVGLSFISSGRYLLTMPSVTVEKVLEAVDKYKARAIVGFPTYLTGLVNHPNADRYDRNSLFYMTSAGQVIGPETMAIIWKLPNLKTFINLYGMTEAGLLVTSADWAAMKNGICQSLENKDYSVGKLPPKTSLKVLDIDTNASLGPNCKGELCFRTGVMIKGYVNRPKDESETFFDGWVKTGDVGYYDEDGYIYVVDRAKDIFKYYNNHISPSEIENVLLRHPAVAEAIVVGIPDPHGGGSIPRAFVVLKPEEKVAQDELILFSKNNLPPYKQLKGGLFVLPQIPVGKTGKVTRKLLSDLRMPISTNV